MDSARLIGEADRCVLGLDVLMYYPVLMQLLEPVDHLQPEHNRGPERQPASQKTGEVHDRWAEHRHADIPMRWRLVGHI